MQNTALRESASREALTAMDSSIGSSGGMTLVMIIVQFSSSLKRSLSGFYMALNQSVLFPNSPMERLMHAAAGYALAQCRLDM